MGVGRLLRSAREHDLVHIHGDAAALACRPAIGLRPTLITLHGSHLLRRSTGLRGRLARAGARSSFRHAAGVICVSESELAFARDIAPRAAERMVLVHNGVPDPGPLGDADQPAAREVLGAEADSVVALFVGELSERKQPVQFALAVERARVENPAVVGAIVGDGLLRPRLETMSIPGTRLLGSRDDVRGLIAAADVFVLPSLWEGLSYALLEAMSLGRATLVSDGPGNPDAVGDAGLVFPASDVGAMTASLLRLTEDAELRRSLGKAAARRARERFSLEQMTDATALVYERALGLSPSPRAEGSPSR